MTEASVEGWRTYTPMNNVLPSIAKGNFGNDPPKKSFPPRPQTTGSLSASYLRGEKKKYDDGVVGAFLLQPIQRPITRMRPTTSANNSTQLADKFPQIDFPQRIESPLDFNAPRRITSTDKKQPLNNNRAKELLNNRKSRSVMHKPPPKSFNHFRVQLKDFDMISRSARRAGLSTGEAAQLYNMGVLYDNMEEYDKALKVYKRYLELCQTNEDPIGMALAYNCIGVDFYYLYLKDGKESRLKSSIQFHNSHLNIADKPGQFVANCNLGLAYGKMGKYEESKEYHKRAVRCAVELQSAHGQSLALGNLALMEQNSGDIRAASECMEQHLDLVKMLGDKTAQSLALQELGKLAISKGEFERANILFTDSRSLAGDVKQTSLSKNAMVQMGISLGRGMFNAAMKNSVKY